MRAQVAITPLRKIAAIRDAQCLAAEGRSVHAAERLRTMTAMLDEAKSEQALAERGWDDMIAASSLPLEMLRLWSVTVMRRDVVVRGASQNVARAEQNLRQRAAEWFAAQRRRDVAIDLLRRARKATALRRDEVGLQDAIDQYAYGRSDA